MDGQEDMLKQRFGQKTPFTVRDGYFEDFVSTLMAKLPEAKYDAIPATRISKPRFSFAMMIAASVVTVVFSVTAFLNKPIQSFDQQFSESVDSYSDTEVDEMADYAMIDNEQLYDYMTEK